MPIDINSNFINIIDYLSKLSKKQLQNIMQKLDITNALKNKNRIHTINYIITVYIMDKAKALSKIKREKVFLLDINSKNKFIIKILDFF